VNEIVIDVDILLSSIFLASVDLRKEGVSHVRSIAEPHQAKRARNGLCWMKDVVKIASETSPEKNFRCRGPKRVFGKS